VQNDAVLPPSGSRRITEFGGMIDEGKAKVYELLTHLGCRVFLTAAFTLAFFIVLGFLLWKPNIYSTIVELMLAPTTFLMAKFFFPSKP
jgi:hypothetical protein